MTSKLMRILAERTLLVLKSLLSKYEFYLYAGIGDPWAGQFRLNKCPSLASKVDDFDVDENFGMDEPTGSAKEQHLVAKYLIFGVGDPWAGQLRLYWIPSLALKASTDDNEENFGAEEPTGSKKITLATYMMAQGTLELDSWDWTLTACWYQSFQVNWKQFGT